MSGEWRRVEGIARFSKGQMSMLSLGKDKAVGGVSHSTDNDVVAVALSLGVAAEQLALVTNGGNQWFCVEADLNIQGALAESDQRIETTCQRSICI